MKTKFRTEINRRDFIKTLATTAIGMTVLPSLSGFTAKPSNLMKRSLGRLNREVTTLGLGGQASLQFTPDDVDPVAIILKAFDKGINYFDTSNVYGPSQSNYGKAFRKLSLIPGLTGYDEPLRKSIFLTSKTHLRFAKGDLKVEGLRNLTNGLQGSHTIDDLKRSLTLIYGDGQGNYPAGAYLDMILIHGVNSYAEVDAVFEGLAHTDPNAERIGALAALRDYRDGTNLTGLNPKEEKRIKHIGFSGHSNPGVMMDMIQRDKDNVLEAMLAAINANDKLHFNMQYNVIPVAAKKNMGIIGMKVFADGAMFTREARWANKPADVVRQVGSPEMPFQPLIEYTLTTPGVSMAVIGIGQISDDPAQCQLSRNIMAAQIKPDGLTEADRLHIEMMARKAKNGKTNYFQMAQGGLTAARNVQAKKQDNQTVRLTWDTAFAGDSPIERYEVWRNNAKVAEVRHVPQTTKEPFKYDDDLKTLTKAEYKIITIDQKNRKAETANLTT